MAEQIISPGVFTRENDLSFLPQGVGAIGAAIVGPTVKGPAFTPTVVKSFSEYERMFGSFSSDTFIPQTVREYLRNAGSVTVTRVLAGGGYEYKLGTNELFALTVSGSGVDYVIAVVAPSKDLSTSPKTLSSSIYQNVSTTFDGAFAINIGTDAVISASLNPTNADYFIIIYLNK